MSWEEPIRPASTAAKRVSSALVFILFLLALSIAGNVILYIEYDEARSKFRSLFAELDELRAEHDRLESDLSTAKEQLEVAREQLDVTRRELATAREQLNAARKQYAGFSEVLRRENWIHIVGVREVRTPEGIRLKGEVMQAFAKLTLGSGRVLITIEPKMGIALQESADIAFRVAQSVTGVDASNLDAILTVVGSEEVHIIDGPSAGMVLTVLFSSLLGNFTINRDVMGTGRIEADGRIETIGGVIEKAIAATEVNASTFLVPPGQKEAYIWLTEEREVLPGFKFVTRTRKLVDAEDYLRSQGYEVTVIEVEDIEEALGYFTSFEIATRSAALSSKQIGEASGGRHG